MIKDIKINIKVSNKNLSHYKKYYPLIKSGDTVLVNVIEIQKGSHIKITGICDICGKEKYISYKDYNTQTKFGSCQFTCCKSCSIIKTENTLLSKFGKRSVFQLETIKEKSRKTKLEKYGDINYNNRDLSSKTCLSTYGVSHVSKLDTVKGKKIKTNIERFGVNYPSQNKNIQKKIINTNIERFGVNNFSKTESFKEILKEKWFSKMSIKMESFGILKEIDNNLYKIKCYSCEKEFDILTNLRNKRINDCVNLCTNCNPKSQNIKQMELFDFISKYTVVELSNRKLLNGKEIDIYVPNLKLGFEFNGLYWHSEVYKDRMYHLDKTKKSLENGINLFHIWEDDWGHKTDIVKSMIINKLGKTPNRIFARKCKIEEVKDNKLVRNFLEENHIQGFVGSKIKLGLFYNGELVSLMTFGNLRKSLGQKSQEGSYEMLRFCNKLNFNVIGGASKLLNYFIKNFKVNEIISYSDSSRSNGNMYKQLGFSLIHETDPNYYWVIDGIRKHRFNFRKDKLVKEGSDPNKTEIQIMTEKGYYRIFDCGNKKWILNI